MSSSFNAALEKKGGGVNEFFPFKIHHIQLIPKYVGQMLYNAKYIKRGILFSVKSIVKRGTR